jgi:hypothetical protein
MKVLRLTTHICKHVFCATMLLSINVVMNNEALKGRKAPSPITDSIKLAALRYVHIVADDAVLNYRACPNGYVISNARWPMDNGMRIDNAVFADFDNLRAFQYLFAFQHGFSPGSSFYKMDYA